MIKKIAITGPESTGKSMLAMQLAEHYGTVWVPEFAREYIDKLGRPYVESDILEIAKGQLLLELAAEKRIAVPPNQTNYLFCDTELLVTKIWSEVRFGHCDPWILKKIETRVYDIYLLCYIDLPWVDDPQREHPEMREHLFNLYHEELLERNLNFRVVSGIGEARLNKAINFIDACLIAPSSTS